MHKLSTLHDSLLNIHAIIDSAVNALEVYMLDELWQEEKIPKSIKAKTKKAEKGDKKVTSKKSKKPQIIDKKISIKAKGFSKKRKENNENRSKH